jgi:3-methyl-2-oxobutanoate hydroxymethyltransferase
LSLHLSQRNYQFPQVFNLDISKALVGIGAGVHCSGQVLVQLDALRGHQQHIPKFCREFGNIGEEAIKGLRQYNDQVKSRLFPVSKEHTYKMQAGEEDKFKEWISGLE